MYVPPHFKSDNWDVARQLITQYAFGILSMPAAPDAITHLPMIVADADGAAPKLIGHVAKANPVWKAFDGAHDAVAIFAGPHAYISPNWYTNENLVPTWNYAAVHVFGKPMAIEDPDAADAILQKLTAAFESDATGNWSMDRLDPDFRRRQLKGIVAFELPISRVETKLKMSQNRPLEDAKGAIEGLENAGDPDALATARMMRKLNGVGA